MSQAGAIFASMGEVDYEEEDGGDELYLSTDIPDSEVLNVVATVGIECLAECVIPSLHLDKKLNPSFDKSVSFFLLDYLRNQ